MTPTPKVPRGPKLTWAQVTLGCIPIALLSAGQGCLRCRLHELPRDLMPCMRACSLLVLSHVGLSHIPDLSNIVDARAVKHIFREVLFPRLSLSVCLSVCPMPGDTKTSFVCSLQSTLALLTILHTGHLCVCCDHLQLVRCVRCICVV